MNVKFFESVIEKHKEISKFTSNSEITTWAHKTIYILFPSSTTDQLHTVDQVQENLEDQKKWLIKLLTSNSLVLP